MSDKDYTIGYQRPPTATQFQKGQSGNPKGRPAKKSKEAYVYLNTAIREELRQFINLQIDGEVVSIPKMHALIKAVYSKAMKGDMRAAEFLAGHLPKKHEIQNFTDPEPVDYADYLPPDSEHED